MARPRIRGFNSRNFDLYPSETLLGWRVLRKVTYAEGDRKVVEGVWREVYDELGNHVGFQIGGNGNSVVMPSKPTATSISAREMQINAMGKSRTAGMNEDQRLTRRNRETGKALPPEDAIERIQAKVRVWPHVEAESQDIVRVWPKK